MFIIYTPVATESLPKKKKKKLPVLGSKREGPGNTLAVLTARKTNYVTAGAWETH